MIAGEPMVGISTNGTSRLPTMAPVVFTASSDPDSPPAVPASSRSRIDAVGKAIPSTMVTGSTTSRDDPNRAFRVSIGFPGSSASGRPMTKTSPSSTSPPTTTWLSASSRSGSPSRERISPKIRAPMAIPARKVARITVKTYVVLPVPDARRRVHVTW